MRYSELDKWWVTHLRNNQTSTLSVDFTATVDYGGRERQLPLESVSYTRTFHTDVLESANASTGMTPSVDSTLGRDRSLNRELPEQD